MNTKQNSTRHSTTKASERAQNDNRKVGSRESSTKQRQVPARTTAETTSPSMQGEHGQSARLYFPICSPDNGRPLSLGVFSVLSLPSVSRYSLGVGQCYPRVNHEDDDFSSPCSLSAGLTAKIWGPGGRGGGVSGGLAG